ncbi:50S ribosomal protein L3 N(5)-glutamine methyltransferase [Methylovirgula sp. 4M-Z18]|uniref:50S ribosomal protein L3 N(5)-glutamine methyltransferase n=1 Tax=Methylovirgula sp. 4M-Z18 TaxID=2293567 RepID=UPI000E2E4C0B|nr:50S ribosomal protein L3 N(5)-glutamine methyltransferase [Methylovirgula sp. 4M-Z18]RFB79628.1 50S ribosomal protein L3 N(5)-glutamine methyltransferase [Methylovirgula sp. 4M-Z18]
MSASPTEHFQTLRDFFRYAISRFNAAELIYGHGTDNAVDEAAFIVLEALHLPVDRLDPFLDARLTADEKTRLADLIDARVTTRKPAAYLLGRTYLKGVPFLVEEGVIVPRSFIGELLMSDALQGEGGLIEDPSAVETILDLCTGGGSLAILAAIAFPQAAVDAVDLSPQALALAKRNVALHRLEDQITLHEGDLFKPLGKRRYDLIITNPPYVTAASVASFPPEYQAEPVMAHLGGEDGLDIVRDIVTQAPKHLNRHGALICEIGAGREAFEEHFPDLPVLWLDTDASEGEVFWLRAEDL